jgi:hypothetical protein
VIKIKGKKIIRYIKVLHIDYWSRKTDSGKAAHDSCYVIYDDYDRLDENGEPLRDQVLYFSGEDIEQIVA